MKQGFDMFCDINQNKAFFCFVLLLGLFYTRTSFVLFCNFTRVLKSTRTLLVLLGIMSKSMHAVHKSQDLYLAVSSMRKGGF